jgi:hypothetical protein
LLHYALYRIAAICKPHVFQDSVPSDWSLLKAQRVRQASATQFYLEHNYIDMMRFMGYSTAACRVVDAAASSGKSGKSGRAQTGNGGGRDSGKGSASTVDGMGTVTTGAGKEAVGLSDNMILAAVLVAGGVMSYGLIFGR